MSYDDSPNLGPTDLARIERQETQDRVLDRRADTLQIAKLLAVRARQLERSGAPLPPPDCQLELPVARAGGEPAALFGWLLDFTPPTVTALRMQAGEPASRPVSYARMLTIDGDVVAFTFSNSEAVGSSGPKGVVFTAEEYCALGTDPANDQLGIERPDGNNPNVVWLDQPAGTSFDYASYQSGGAEDRLRSGLLTFKNELQL